MKQGRGRTTGTHEDKLESAPVSHHLQSVNMIDVEEAYTCHQGTSHAPGPGLVSWRKKLAAVGGLGTSL